MDWLEEVTTRQADIILANSNFTARIFKTYFPSIPQTPTVVHPGINLDTYQTEPSTSDSDVASVRSDRPTLISLNRFEGKKNIILALEAFARLKKRSSRESASSLRLVLAGGYDPRLEDSVLLLDKIRALAQHLSLSYSITSTFPLPPELSNISSPEPDILILLNFTTAQRTALLRSPSTLALLYTPENEHFGIVPTEAMACGVPVLACDSGGPLESVVSLPPQEPSSPRTSQPRTGWLRKPDPDIWAAALEEILALTPQERKAIAETAKHRARNLFGMEAMAKRLEEELEDAVKMGPVRSDEVFGVWWKVAVMLLGFLIAYGERSDHEIRNAWIGPAFPLDLSTLPVRSEEIPLQYPDLKLGYSAASSPMTIEQRLKLGEKVETILKGDDQAAHAPPRES
ncbi:hypothetical protein MD484_g6781, partial [Candolleomyces efflorescens]